ncbi:MAG: GGDEF domain-containing protein [Bacteroidota bacterium]
MPHSFLVFIVFLSGIILTAVPFSIVLIRQRKKTKKDSLTGLPDYRSFELQLIKSIRCLEKKNHPFGVVLMDVDDFHQYNKTGYEKGDEVLKNFAAALFQNFSDIAFCARFRMGDEFVLLFDPAEENEIVKRLEEKKSNVNYTYSLIVFDKPKLSSDAAIKQLQQLLFENKHMKRKID